MSDKPTIQPMKNGPYRVSGLKKMTTSRGEAIETQDSMILCRCGQSKNKPFCDMTHRSVGFTDEKQDGRQPDRLDTYPGKDGLTVLDNRGICSHAGYCTGGMPEVWNGAKEPWIDAKNGPNQGIIDTIRKCPSGALSYKLGDELHNAYHDEPEVHVSRNGPLWIRGGVELVETDRLQGQSPEHAALCRCGQSRNKPYCDGSHWYVGFKDNEDATISKAHQHTGETERSWVTVADAGELAQGTLKKIAVAGRELVLGRTEQGVFACDAQCPHQGGPMAEGTIDGGVIRCPWHGFDFDVSDGQGIGNEFKLPTFEAREADGKIAVLAPQPVRNEWTVSHLMLDTLNEWGLDTVFGMVGHSNLGVAEAVRSLEAQGKMRYIAIRHEGAASFAASGYAKVTGKPAACLAIAGPGATNMLTGLWDAKMDRAPVLALTGQVNTQYLGPGSFQEIDLPSAFAAVSRFSQTVLSNSNHRELAALAAKHAIVERQVAHLIFPDEVQKLEAGNVGPARPEGRVSETAIAPPEQSLNFAVWRIMRAKRPLIIVGYGAREHMAEVMSLAEAHNIPVITTFKAKGQIGDDHMLAGGVLGRSGTPVGSSLMTESDMLIVFGASFSDHTGIDANKPIIQVDYDRMALGKFHPVEEAVWGDIGITATKMQEKLAGSEFVDQRPRVAELWASWRQEKARRAAKDEGKGLNSAIVFQRLSGLLPPDAVLSVDVGNNTYSFGRYFECSNHQTVIMSGYLGSIGFGFPAAMGAWAAVGDQRRVVAIAGDGGFGQYLAEFTTAVRYDMNIVLILLHNGELGKISDEQRHETFPVWQTGLTNPNFSEYAKLCGGEGLRVTSADQIEPAVRQALASAKPTIVEIMTDAALT